jgi:GlcNAc-P-P-Und epimerase
VSQSRILCTGASGFIGTNLMDLLLGSGAAVLNVDKQPPKKKEHHPCWVDCNIMDYPRLEKIFHDFRPDCVVHLAARADTNGTMLKEYFENTNGTENVLGAIRSTDSISHVVITSTQYVHRPGHLPENDEDFEPHTIYGESKVITEKLTRSANLDAVWTIIRPTNIWGPWHPRYPYEFWAVLNKGLYLQPGGQRVMRSYGFVGNIAYQIGQILVAPAKTVNGQVYYVGDAPFNLLDWTNGFSRAITGKNVKIVPRAVVQTAALVGDVLSSFGVKFPITSSRFQSMTTDYLTPMSKTLDVFGVPPFTLEAGIQITVDWLKAYGFIG